MRKEIVCDSRQPSRADGVEARLFERIEHLRCRRARGLMTAVDRWIVEARAKGQAIAKGSQARQRGGIRLRDRGVGVVESTEDTRARADRLDNAIGKCAAHAFPGPRRSSGRSCPMQRW